MTPRENYRKQCQADRITLSTALIPTHLPVGRELDRIIGSLLGWRVIPYNTEKGSRNWEEFRWLRGRHWRAQGPRPSYWRMPIRTTQAEAYEDFPFFSSTEDKYLLMDMLDLLKTLGQREFTTLLAQPSPAYSICLEILKRITNA